MSKYFDLERMKTLLIFFTKYTLRWFVMNGDENKIHEKLTRDLM